MRSATLALVLSFASIAHADLTADPNGIAGEWNYETRSSCGGHGRGRITFTRNEDGSYEERGFVRWPSGLIVRWWGTVRLDAPRRFLGGRVDNSLGDQVDAHWTLDAIPPSRLRVSWSQTNGCRGTGTALR